MTGDALGLVREAGGTELVERLLHLERVRHEPVRPDGPARRPRPGEQVDFDVLIAGGGLSLLYAPLLAARGLRVAVIDRARVGQAHREWNASRRELAALVLAGAVSEAELETLIVARYRAGVCRWHGGGEYLVRDVLDCAVDASALLTGCRQRAAALGVALLDNTELTGLQGGPDAVAATLREGDRVFDLTARVVLDARGAASPYATADLVCPTVGGTLGGLELGSDPNQIDPELGEILVTTEGIEAGRQHVWETFPGRRGRATVYLFHYAEVSRDRGSLVALFARFFERLPHYKRGSFTLERPSFGFIPGWSRLGPAPAAPHPRVVLVGDAAARHSPLTFCGFGATLRSLAPVCREIVGALERNEAPRGCVDDRAIHSATGALALMLARPASGDRDRMNRLLDHAFASIHAMGEQAYGELLRDELSLRDIVRFLRSTARRDPSVYVQVARALGPVTSLRWGHQVARSLLSEARQVRA